MLPLMGPVLLLQQSTTVLASKPPIWTYAINHLEIRRIKLIYLVTAASYALLISLILCEMIHAC